MVILAIVFSSMIGLNNSVIRFQWLNSGLDARLDFMEAAIRIAFDYPLTGVGINAFNQISPAYAPFSPLGKILTHVHSDWLELLTENGWLGLVFGFGIVVFVLQLVFRSGLSGHSSTRWLVAGCLSAILAILVHSSFDILLQNPALMMALLTIMALAMNLALIRHKTVDQPLTKNVESLKPKQKQRLNDKSIPLAFIAIALVLTVCCSWLQINHWRAQSLVRTERNSFADQRPVMDPDRLLAALDLEPDNPEYWYRLANILAGSKDLNLTKEIRERLRDHLDDRVRFAFRPRVLARIIQKQAIILAPSQAKQFAQLAWLELDRLGALKTTERLMSRAVKLDPFNAEWPYQWGQLYLHLGKPGLAKDRFKAAIKLNRGYKGRIGKLLKSLS